MTRSVLLTPRADRASCTDCSVAVSRALVAVREEGQGRIEAGKGGGRWVNKFNATDFTIVREHYIPMNGRREGRTVWELTEEHCWWDENRAGEGKRKRSRGRRRMKRRRIRKKGEGLPSSSRTTGGSFKRHLAMATRCFSPPLSFNPLSPTLVSH